MNRIKILDFVRGLSCIWVFTFHANGWFQNVQGSDNFLAHYIFQFGYAGVQIFFVLSGFVIFLSIDSWKQKPDGIRHYLIGRFKRIYPTYWLSIVFVLLLTALAYYINPETTLNSDFTYWFSQITLSQLFFSQTFLVGPYWSLAYEVQFYLVCIPFVVMNKNYWQPYFFFLIIISMATKFFFKDLNFLFTYHYLEFSLGGLLYLIIAKVIKPTLGILIFVVFLLFAFVDTYWELKVASLAMIIFYFFIFLEQRGLRVPKISYFLGGITYPLYLIHQPLLFRLDKFVDRIPTGFWFKNYFVVFIFSFVIALIFSYWIYKYFEQRLIFKRSTNFPHSK